MPPRKRLISFEEGWAKLQPDIDRLVALCDGGWAEKPDSWQVLALYSVVYDMGVQRPPNSLREQLYARYTAVYVDYLAAAVVPALRQLGGGALLREVGLRWADYRELAKWMKKVFLFLYMNYKDEQLPPVHDVAMNAFRDAVFPLVRAQRAAVLRGDDGDAAVCDWEGLRVLFGVMEGELTAAGEQKEEPEPEPELEPEPEPEARTLGKIVRQPEQDLPAVQRRLKHADPNDPAEFKDDKCAPLWRAAEQGHVEVVDALADAGADLGWNYPGNGRTALHAAAEGCGAVPH